VTLITGATRHAQPRARLDHYRAEIAEAPHPLHDVLALAGDL
jgi:hypothetical protein